MHKYSSQLLLVILDSHLLLLLQKTPEILTFVCLCLLLFLKQLHYLVDESLFLLLRENALQDSLHLVNAHLLLDVSEDLLNHLLNLHPLAVQLLGKKFEKTLHSLVLGSVEGRVQILE